ncbi:MAG: hypothetical protein H7323_08980 [Frankiales bacterium]|nr:hypothetical protein [Frankiales bacterium]
MRTGRLRAAAVLAALVAAVAAPAAWAHPARDERPGAPQLDLEVLVTPPLDNQLTPGGLDADVAVDAFGNRTAVARKELPVSPDPRAPRPVRTASWRWASIDRGDSWGNLDALPLRADLLLPEGGSVAVAAAGARTVLAEDQGGVVRVQSLLATGLGRLTAGTPGFVPTVTSRPVDVAVNGQRVLLLAGSPSGAYAAYHSGDGGATFGAGVPLGTASGCRLAVDPRASSKVVAAVCAQGAGLFLELSTDDGATFARRRVGGVDQRDPAGVPAVDIGPDGRIAVLSGMAMATSRDLGRRWLSQDLQVESGDYRSTSLAISPLGRVAVAAYRRTAPGGPWTVVTTIFSPGRRPVLSDFSSHSPVAPQGAAAPPSTRTSLDFGADGRMQLVWTSTYLQSEDLGRPLLRNVWSIRSNST